SSSTTISVQFSASDSSGAGLDKVDLYAKAPGDSGYAKVATDSSPTSSGTFSYDAAAGDGTYRFYSVATAKAHNAEALPSSADTDTLLDTAKPASPSTSPALSSTTTTVVV